MSSPFRREALATSMSPQINTVLERLSALHPKVIDLSLGRIEGLLAKLGNPERSLPPVVHIAGTNGKGSSLAFLRAMLEAAGYRCHVYTSPHLVKFNERIRLAGKLIEDDELTAMLEECEAANDGDEITYFEITTAAAFLAFSRTPADVLLLETGLGGRLDATNVISAPLVTAITTVSVDHQQYLGDDVEDIAAAKAGILKVGVPCVLAKQDRKPDKRIAGIAKDVGAPLLVEGRDWFVRKQQGGMLFDAVDKDGAKTITEYPLPSLAGIHQPRNAGLALAVLDCMAGFDVPLPARALGLKSASWPARLQRLNEGPLVDLLPDGWELWLDGGHNEAAAKTIRAQRRVWRDKPLHMVMGMLNSKDPLVYLKHLEARLGLFRGVAIPGEDNSLTANEVTEAALSWRMEARAAASVAEAIADIVKTAPATPGRILISGSLYLAGTVLADNA